MFKTFINAFKVKEIRMRLLFVFACLIIVRIGSLIPTPGINQEVFKAWIETSQLNLGFLDTLTGGSFSQMAIFALSISPYINASIIIQLLTIVIPSLEEMQKDGEDGRQKLNNLTRYIAVGLALIEATALAISFGKQGYLEGGLTFKSVAMVVISFVAATCFLMWLGEKITEKGVGNGISIILLINIVARLPQDMKTLFSKFVTGASSVITGIFAAIVIVAIIFGLVVLIVLLQDAERRIPVQYTRKIVGRKQAGGSSSFIPLKVNTSGVIPVIFAMSILQAPIIISSLVGVTGDRVNGNFWQKCLHLFDQNNWVKLTPEGEFKLLV